MGKYSAQAAFGQLASEYFDLMKKYQMLKNPMDPEMRQAGNIEAQKLVNNLRREHHYALDVYYRTDRHINMRIALKNDLSKGGIKP